MSRRSFSLLWLFPVLLLGFLSLATAQEEAPPPKAIPQDALRRFEADIVRQKTEQQSSRAEKEPLPGGFVKMTGRYRLAAGAGRDLILNDSNSGFNLYNLQGPSSEYLSGERLYNTFDRAIYDQLLLNIDFSPTERVNFYTQIVSDPWSWVGTTGEQAQQSDPDRTILMRYNLKYFGANNSTLGESYRNNIADLYNFPAIKVHDGRIKRVRIEGLDDFDGVVGDKRGIPFSIADLDIDYEYKPIRKLWMDYTGDGWTTRLFVLADETQALTTDDPLGLSNHKDYWEASPWLYQYQPIQYFTDHSVKRGFYSDALAFKARDSEGNRLVLLRGASLQINREKTTVAATVASPRTPWDEGYFHFNNIPGAVRLKHEANERLTVGGTYTFRSGLIDNGLADFSQAAGIDTEYQWKKDTVLKTELAASSHVLDIKTNERMQDDRKGFAAKVALETHRETADEDRRDFVVSGAFMDKYFTPPLSRYLNTRDDRFWGLHLSFDDRPDVEPFKLGDGLDINRLVLRMHWKEERFKKRFLNLLDVRNVHRARNTAYVETVARDEVTYKFNPRLTGKALVRWRGLPKTTKNVEPTLTGYYFALDNIDPANFYIQNTAVPEGRNADQWTFSGGLQYWINDRWAVEGIAERTNLIPDFPRGVLNDFFRDASDRIDGILEDRLMNFLYGQSALKAVPPYPYYSVFKERVIYKPSEQLRFTVHATQNGYHFAGGIDDNMNHEGISVGYNYSEKLAFFMDYTHSRQVDIPNLVASSYSKEKYDDHHNVYVSADYRINSSTVFRAEYGVFGLGSASAEDLPYSVTSLSLPTLDTEHLLRVSLTGDF